jgi:HAD superfamily hydrolase (TIGR01509 family)
MVGITAEETAEYVMQAANVRFDPHSAVTNVWREVTRRISSEAEPLPDAVELVSELAERGLPLAIASNSPSAYIQKALNGLGLSKYFGYTIGVDQVAQGKPAPEIYLRAAEALGAPPERCLAIEDSLAGSQSALNAGMRVLAVPQKHSDPAGFQACYRVFDSLGCIRREMESVLR